MARTGILGGTFNPIHYGHLQLGQAAMEECGLDRVLIMPSGVSYLKKDINIPEGDIRLELCRLASKGMDKFELSDIEIKRKGNTYTYETLAELKGIYPEDELYFIVGADSLYYMDKWVEARKIFELSNIVCAIRGEGSEEELSKLGLTADSLRQRFDAEIIILKASVMDISSTEIRKMISDGASGDTLIKFLPEEEYNYIIKHGIYAISETGCGCK